MPRSSLLADHQHDKCSRLHAALRRRRGIASRLCLGVARDGGEVAARAWVEIGKDKVVGGAGTERFTRLAAFGHASR